MYRVWKHSALILIFIKILCEIQPSDSSQIRKTKVIIIGAGISGAGAASTLTSAGITDFIVLEAQSIIGGRMKQGTISGLKVEVGANWVEGIGGKLVNPIWTFAQDLNMTVTETDYSNSVTIKEDGSIEQEDVIGRFLKKLTLAESMMEERGEIGLEDISVKTALYLSGWHAQTPSEDCAEYNGIEKQFAGESELLSGFYTLREGTFADFGDGAKFVTDQRGYKIIPEFIFSEANATGKIEFHQKVIQIAYSDQGVRVKTEDGTIWEADYLISTVSLGVYQNDRIKFTPPLSDWKIEALFKFKMEIYTKIFLNFPSQFWDKDKLFTFFADNEKGFYPEWQNLMLKDFFGEIAPNGSHLIMATLVGDQSRRVERMTDEEIKDEIDQVLKRIYPGKIIPRAQAILVPRWGMDPLFHGSFTNWPIGMTTESWQNLVAPLNQRIFFGGEMASEFYFGYVHGGYLAGVDAANDVAACIAGKCNAFEYYPNGLKGAVQEPVILAK